MRWLRHLLVGLIAYQAVIGLSSLVLRAWHNLGSGAIGRLTASPGERIEHTLRADTTIATLISSRVPTDAIVFVDWPATFQADPNATDIGQEARPIIHWIRTIEKVRLLLYPSPTVFRMFPGAFTAAEGMAAAGADVWIAAPGELLIADIAPQFAPQAVEDPASFGLPKGRAGWSLAASNPRCQLWRYRKD